MATRAFGGVRRMVTDGSLRSRRSHSGGQNAVWDRLETGDEEEEGEGPQDLKGRLRALCRKVSQPLTCARGSFGESWSRQVGW